jgi:hypothetical protein
MEKELLDIQNATERRDLPVMASELLLWPHSQICVISNEFDDNMVNRNEFEGYCNGYLSEYEEDQITAALCACDNSKNQFDISRPLVVSATAHSRLVEKIAVPTVLYISCGAVGAWKYELTAGFEEGVVSGLHMFTRDEKGSQTVVTDEAVGKLFTVIKKVLSHRLARTGKVEFLIK